MTQRELHINPEINFVRDNEGNIYGEGAADLIQGIKDALDELPKPVAPDVAAQAIHRVLYNASKAIGQNPDIETFYRVTGDEGERTYHVSWESGPYDWSIQASFVVMDCINRLCEPYYGFDLMLYDVE